MMEAQVQVCAHTPERSAGKSLARRLCGSVPMRQIHASSFALAALIAGAALATPAAWALHGVRPSGVCAGRPGQKMSKSDA
jgi:hypothetical protein